MFRESDNINETSKIACIWGKGKAYKWQVFLSRQYFQIELSMLTDSYVQYTLKLKSFCVCQVPKCVSPNRYY